MVKAVKAVTSIRIPFSEPETAEVVADSLKHEELLPKSTRTEVNIKRRENILYLKVNAKDTAALRAALNSFLRWAAVARDMTKV
ncbi:MAG: CTAG/PCC1 family protein [Hadesarchaea archaeon]|nr:CTAG/PCC1 family protein [Hadesarchaea archaeon]